MTYYQPRSYGEMAILKRGLGDAAADATAESIFGKIVGGLAQVASAVVPAVIGKNPTPTGNSTVDDLLRKLSAGTALPATSSAQPVATTATVGGISLNTILIVGAIGVGAALLLKKRGR